MKIEEKNKIISFTSDNVVSDQGVVIYPANLVSPWQYQDFSDALARSGTQVFIVEPAWRFSSAGRLALSMLQNSHPDITRWLLVGNSAGASLACKDKAANPHITSEVVVVNGYCKNIEFQPILAIFGSDDWLVKSSSHAGEAQRSEVVQGGHFLLTDRKKSAPGHAQAISLISQILDN